MTQDIFIKIDGITGESQDAIHEDEIDVLTWRWQVSQSSSMLSGSGGGAAKATVSDLEFTHALDRATPNLAKYCFSGQHIPKAILTLRKAGGIAHEYFRIILYDVVITHVEPLGSADGCDEQVHLSFATMKQEYILQNQRGGNGGAVTSTLYIKNPIK